jgi:hypothetical protein
MWTLEQREKARQRIIIQKPWTKLTGPKTQVDKVNVSKNALKYGLYFKKFKDFYCSVMYRSRVLLSDINK